MRIWIVNQFAVSPKEPGGTRHYALARALIRAGNQVVIVGSNFNYVLRGRRATESVAPGLQLVEGVPFFRVSVPAYQANTLAKLWSMLSFAARVLRVRVEKIGFPPDVIVGSSPHLFGAWAAERLARRLGVPFVLEVRDLWPQSLIDVGGLSRHHPLVIFMRWLERGLYRRANHIVSLLPGAAAYMTAMGADASKIAWIPNGIDLAATPLLPPPPREGPFTVLYLGAHGVANGLDSILNAAQALETEGRAGRLRFRFVGDGPERLRLMARAKEAGLDYVEFMPAIPRGEVSTVLAGAHACILTLRDSPLYRWGISLNKIFDYLAAARPIVFGAGATQNPVAEAEAGIIVPPENGGLMADAVRRLMTMTDAQRAEMGRRGRLYAERHHDTQLLATRFADVLRRVIR